MKPFYHGTRANLKPGDLIEPRTYADVGEQNLGYVYLTPNLDGAIWESELARGEDPGRVYIVEPVGQIEDRSELANFKSPGHPFMSWRSCQRYPRQVGETIIISISDHDLSPDKRVQFG